MGKRITLSVSLTMLVMILTSLAGAQEPQMHLDFDSTVGWQAMPSYTASTAADNYEMLLFNEEDVSGLKYVVHDANKAMKWKLNLRVDPKTTPYYTIKYKGQHLVSYQDYVVWFAGAGAQRISLPPGLFILDGQWHTLTVDLRSYMSTVEDLVTVMIQVRTKGNVPAFFAIDSMTFSALDPMDNLENRSQLSLEWSLKEYVERQVIWNDLDISGQLQLAGAAAVAEIYMVATEGQNATHPVTLTQASEIIPVHGRLGIAISTRDIEPGAYTLRLKISDHSGATLTSQTKEVTIKPLPQWVLEQPGKEFVVLPPWTPIVATENYAEIWGRTVTFRDGLPSQLTSQGAQLLANPIAIEVDTEAGPFTHTSSLASFTPGDARSTWLTKLNSQGSVQLAGEIRTTLEFDGMLRFDLKLAAASAVENIRLVIPLAEETASFIHYMDEDLFRGSETFRIDIPQFDAQTETDYGSTESIIWSSSFRPYVWLGNDRHGLAWFSETDKPFRTENPDSVIQVVRRGDAVCIVVNMVTKPTDFGTDPFEWTFGIQSTPTKPMPVDKTMVRKAPAPQARFETVWWPNFSVDMMPYPRAKDPVNFASRVQKNESVGMLTVPHMALSAVSDLAPEFKEYGQGWTRLPLWQQIAEGQSKMIVTPSSGWGLFLPWAVADLIARTGTNGLYFDFGFVYSDTNLGLGNGYYDEEGVLKPTWPIFDTRETLRRVYTILKTEHPDSIIMTHMSNNMFIPLLSFTDITVDGEHLRQPLQSVDGDYSQVITLDELRAVYSGVNWGPIPYIIPELAQMNGATNLEWTQTPERSETLMAYVLLHDIGVWPTYINRDVLNKIWAAQDAFEVEGASFIPYYVNDVVLGQSESIKVSVWNKGSRVLLVVANLSNAAELVELELDTKQLNLSGALMATDLYSLTQVNVLDAQTLQFQMRPKSFRLIVVRQNELR